MSELVTKKIIQSGSIVEVYEYSKGYVKGYDLKGLGGRKSGERSDAYEDNRKQHLKRAKANLRRIINANVGQYGEEFTAKFLTLTFKENITDLSYTNREFTKFIKRLNYKVFNTKISNLKYTAVVEFQKRGAIHYHVILYNIPYIKADEISQIWGNGFIKINKIDNITNVGAYLAEYLGGDEDEKRLEGRRSYFSSRGLFKPVEITDRKIVETVGAALPLEKMTYSATYENEYLGEISYKQYNLKIE